MRTQIRDYAKRYGFPQKLSPSVYEYNEPPEQLTSIL
jgi:hypothetical protein